MPTHLTPPTAKQVQAHLRRFSPRGPSRPMSWIVLALLAVVLVVSFTSANPLVALLPLAALGALLIAANVRVARLRRLEQQVQQAQELALVRRYPQSLRLAWRTLPATMNVPPLHGRTVACMAHNLDQLQAYDAAVAAYDYLIEHIPAADPGSIQFQIMRSLAQLANQQLTDADDALRRLRNVIDRFGDTAIGAAYRFAQLAQQVCTNHYAEAVAQADTLLHDLRPLGVDAGYGHGLMALAYHQLAAHEPTPDLDLANAADLWWSRATLLLPTSALVDRFPQLQALKIEPGIVEP